jgi:HAD superfamily hydrolase (TIGR01509 family)
MAAIVFDFDGVLADTGAGWARAEAAFCNAHGIEYTPDLAARTHGVALEDAVSLLTAPREIDVRAGAALLRSLAVEHVPAGATTMVGAVDVLAAVRAAHLPVGVASNSERDLLEQMLGGLGLMDLVDVVVSATDVDHAKPAPDVYVTAASLLGVAPRSTLVVEDSSTGATAALAAGCQVVHFGVDPFAAEHAPAADEAPARVRSHHDLILQLGLSLTRPPAQTSEGTS